MTFNTAYEIALNSSELFKRHVENVAAAMKTESVASSCILFVIDGTCFYYGFDGVEIQKGKHTPKRSEYLIKNNQCLIIR